MDMNLKQDLSANETQYQQIVGAVWERVPFSSGVPERMGGLLGAADNYLIDTRGSLSQGLANTKTGEPVMEKAEDTHEDNFVLDPGVPEVERCSSPGFSATSNSKLSFSLSQFQFYSANCNHFIIK